MRTVVGRVEQQHNRDHHQCDRSNKDTQHCMRNSRRENPANGSVHCRLSRDGRGNCRRSCQPLRHDHRRGIQRIAATVDAVPFLTWCNLSSPDAALRGGVIDLIEVRLMCVGAGPTLDYESAVAFLAAFEPVIEQARRRSCNEGLAVPQTHGHIFRREPGFPSSGAGARGEAASKVRKATGGDAVGPASECQTAAPCTNRRCHCVVGSDGICRTYAVAPPPSASAFGAGAGFTGKGRFARSDHPPRLKDWL